MPIIVYRRKTGPPNDTMVLNGGLEDGVTTPWDSFTDGAASLSVTTEGVRAGAYALRYDISTAGTNVQVYQYNQFSVVDTLYYRFRYSVKASVEFYQYVSIHDIVSPFNTVGYEEVKQVFTTWTDYDTTFQATQTADCKLYFQINGDLGNNTWLMLDRVSLQLV